MVPTTLENGPDRRVIPMLQEALHAISTNTTGNQSRRSLLSLHFLRIYALLRTLGRPCERGRKGSLPDRADQHPLSMHLACLRGGRHARLGTPLLVALLTFLASMIELVCPCVLSKKHVLNVHGGASLPTSRSLSLRPSCLHSLYGINCTGCTVQDTQGMGYSGKY